MPCITGARLQMGPHQQLTTTSQYDIKVVEDSVAAVWRHAAALEDSDYVQIGGDLEYCGEM